MEDYLRSESFLLSDWKVIWTGVCAVLRTSIDLFQVDRKSCINSEIRDEIGREWNEVGANREDHLIFWHFLRRERDNIVHQYEWSAYEMWMDESGSLKPAKLSLINIRPEDHRSVLIMRNGAYQGRNSVELLQEGAAWAEERIFSAIRRAGFDPDESRNVMTFERPPSIASGTVLGGIWNET